MQKSTVIHPAGLVKQNWPFYALAKFGIHLKVYGTKLFPVVVKL